MIKNELEEKIRKIDALLISMENAKPVIRKPLEDARDALKSKLASCSGSAKPKLRSKVEAPVRAIIKPTLKVKKKRKKFYQATGDLSCFLQKKGDQVFAVIKEEKYLLRPQKGYAKVWDELLQLDFPTRPLVIQCHPGSSPPNGRCKELFLWGFFMADGDGKKKNLNRFKMRGVYDPLIPGKISIPRNPRAKKFISSLEEIIPKSYQIIWEVPELDRPCFVDLICCLKNGVFFSKKEKAPPSNDLPRILEKEDLPNLL